MAKQRAAAGKEQVEEESAADQKLQFSLGKALQVNGKWDTDSFTRFPDAVHWLRQIIALVFGVLCGIWPLTGVVAIGAFLFLNTYIPYYYYTSYANVNVDDFGAQKLLLEGYQASAALFMLTWVLVYSSSQM